MTEKTLENMSKKELLSLVTYLENSLPDAEKHYKDAKFQLINLKKFLEKSKLLISLDKK